MYSSDSLCHALHVLRKEAEQAHSQSLFFQKPSLHGGGWVFGKGNLPGRCPDAEFVAVGIGELSPFAPWFSAQLLRKSDPTSFERLTRFFDIVGVQDVASEASFVAATLSS